MPGPPPKHPSTRARTNRTSTHAKLRLGVVVPAPDLPDGLEWHQMTRAWWSDVWTSPMAPEYDDSDRHGLMVLAAVVNDFWTADTARERRDLAAEIRQQGQRFGLSPIDRRRLQWEIERTDEAQHRGERRRAAAVAPSAATDPRSLHVV